VVRVVVDDNRTPHTYTLDGTREIQLQELGEGWHAADTGYGTNAANLTVSAYDSTGATIDTVVQPMLTPPVSSSSPPA
jgi:hypothetical protein